MHTWTKLPSWTGRTARSTKTVLPCGSTLKIVQTKAYREAWGRSTTVLRCTAVLIAQGAISIGAPHLNLHATRIPAARVEALAWASARIETPEE